MSTSHGRPTVAEVSRAALRRNCAEAVRVVGPDVAVLAVVKADGYGHGAVEAARAFLAGGATALGVSTVDEGVRLRRAGIGAPVVVLGGAFAGEAATAVAHDLAVAVWTAESGAALAAIGRAEARPARVHLKIETGMTRLGVDVAEAAGLGRALAAMDGLVVDGVFSHFASADAVESVVVTAQLLRFRTAVDALAAVGVRPAWVHVANSAAVLALRDAHDTMVRPGLMLYGHVPAAHLAGRARLEPAMALRTRIAHLRAVPAGTPVGYAGTFVTARPSTIAVLPIGYADGLHRLASNRGQMRVRGRRAPIAGRICMDHTMLDVTEVPGVAVGDGVTVFGGPGAGAVSADEVAAWTETIAYEVLTAVGARVPRVYVEEFGDA